MPKRSELAATLPSVSRPDAPSQEGAQVHGVGCPRHIWERGDPPPPLHPTNLPVLSLKGSCWPPSRELLLLVAVASSSPG